MLHAQKIFREAEKSFCSVKKFFCILKNSKSTYKIGTVLGKKNVNIAHMTWARKSQAGEAIVVLSTDEAVGKAEQDEVAKIDDITWVKAISL